MLIQINISWLDPTSIKPSFLSYFWVWTLNRMISVFYSYHILKIQKYFFNWIPLKRSFKKGVILEKKNKQFCEGTVALLQNGVPSSVVAWETPVKLPSSLSPRITKFQPTQWGQQNLWFLKFIPLDGHLNMTIHTVCILFWIPKRQTIVSRNDLSLGYSEQDTSSVNYNHSKCLPGSPSN